MLRGDLPIVLDGLGTATPLALVTVQSQLNGTLVDVEFLEGQMVKKGDVLALLEDDLGPIQKRLNAGAELPVSAWDRSNTKQIATGALETIDNLVDVTTGTFKLRVIFANDDKALFPDQFVNARLLVDTLKGATLVPDAAVQTGAPGTYVHLANTNGTASVRTVKTGPSGGTRTAILSGLSPGEQVAVDGADRLRDGARNTTPAVILNVQRQPGANVITTVDRIKALLPQLQATLPASLVVTPPTDRTVTIRASVADAAFDLGLAVVLVVLVIFLFLRNVPATLIPSLSVPLSLISVRSRRSSS